MVSIKVMATPLCRARSDLQKLATAKALDSSTSFHTIYVPKLAASALTVA
jgi:hypothetical protein